MRVTVECLNRCSASSIPDYLGIYRFLEVHQNMKSDAVNNYAKGIFSKDISP